MYLTHGSQASVEGFGDRDGRRGARGTEDHREVRGIGDSSESLVGSDPGDIAGKQQPQTCRADAAPHDGRRPGRGQEGAGCQRRFPVITARSMDCSSEPGVIAAGAGALPGARRRCEAGKRTHGPGPRACLALLAAAALALGVAENAAAQTTLVSNVVATSGVADISFNQEAAQAFTTGATGATVSSVEIISSDTQGDDFDLSLCETSANDRPTSTCTELTAPSSFAAGTLVFTAPANTTLDPTTTYAVLMTPESESVRVPGLGSNDEDTGGAMGWTIADTHQFTNTANDWRTSTPGGGRSLRIAIKGTLTASANTAPTAAHNTVTTGEDRPYAFTANDFEFDDDDAGDTLASVKIVTPPGLGTLALDGTAVMADGVVTEAQIDADMLTFTPARDAHGDPYTTFTFTVNDGTDDSTSAYTMTIDVTDAPAPVCAVPNIAGDGRRQIWTGTVTVGPFDCARCPQLLLTDTKNLVVRRRASRPLGRFRHRFEITTQSMRSTSVTSGGTLVFGTWTQTQPPIDGRHMRTCSGCMSATGTTTSALPRV